MRATLVARLKDIENSVRGLLRGFGLRLPKALRGRWELAVRDLLDGHPSLLQILGPLLGAREALREQLDRIDRRVRDTAKADAVCRRLMSAPGVGVIVALTFRAAVDGPERFRSSKQVGACFGLTPRKYQSGETDRNGAISRAGDASVRVALFEAAHVILTRVSTWSSLKAWAMNVAKRHGDADPKTDRLWLVQNLIVETGKGLWSGQWGGAKTFGVLNLSASVMTGEPFAGRKVIRRGGVLFIASEGAFEIPIRLRGLGQGKLGLGADERLPFAWIEECPRLLSADAVAQLAATAKVAAEHLSEEFDLPLALIVIDTVAAAAGFGDENSAAEAQKVMNAMEALSRQTGAFVLGVDHFGKSAETGTRGSSAKEAAADVILAMLANRDDAGNISNLRMAVRKVRGARSGYEIPFDLEVVTVGEIYDGEPITTCVVNWQTDRTSSAATATAKERWPASLRIFRDAITAAIGEHGVRAWPYGSDGAEVRAVAFERIRDAFYTIYPAGGDDEVKRAETKRKAFNRAVTGATGRNLTGSVELNCTDYLWLKTSSDNPDSGTCGTHP